MSLFFDEASYLRSKLALMSDEEKAEKHVSTTAELKAYMEGVGLTPEAHYNLYGRFEGLNPNAYFNENEYLLAKLEQLHSINERDANGQPFTLETLKGAIAGTGLTPAEHYELYGSHETKADGTLINPSNAFDANAYAAAKLYQLQHSSNAAEAAAWADKTPVDVMEAITDAGMSPVSHYITYGAGETNAGKVPMVQTVPSEQRVANDPLRDQLGENVPSNYNPPSEGPKDAKAAPVDKPADMGDLANHTVSPQVTPPSDPLKVPGDEGYVAPPDNITDTNANPVIPPSTSGTGQVSDNYLVVNSDKSAIVVDKDGTILGEVGVSTEGGAVTVPPSEASKPADKLPAVDPDDLPPNVEAGNAGDNVKPDTPDTPDIPVVPTPTPPAAPSIEGNIAGDNVIDMGEAHKNVLIKGMAEADSTVEITVANGEKPITASGEADSTGAFSISLSPSQLATLSDGDLTITAMASNSAGTSGIYTHKTKVTLDAKADATVTHGDSFGYTAPEALEGATLGSLNPNGTGLLDELQKVYSAGANSINLDYLKTNAPNISKLVHFSDTKQISTTDVLGGKSADHYNLKIDGVYGGGVALTVGDLKAAFETSRLESLSSVISNVYFDVPSIKAAAQNVVNLEVDKVGSIHQGALTADLLNQDLTFSYLVQLFSEMKPIAVDVQAPRLDIHLGDDKNADIVNLMEVRGTVGEITFSGTKGLFGLNIDAHPGSSASNGTVKNIDASSLTDGESSGVYVNTAPIGISYNTTNTAGDSVTLTKGVNATVADNLIFKGSAGDDILVMAQDKYGKANALDGGKNGDAGDTLAILVDAEAGKDTSIKANEHMTGFENVAFVSFAMTQDEETGGYTFSQFSADASSFAAKGVKNFITSNDLTLDNYGGETVTVVGGLDGEVKINLKDSSTTSATINLAMTSNFLNTALSVDGETEGKAVLTNADCIKDLTLKGADANATIAFTKAALDDIAGGKITVDGFKGHIQVESYQNASESVTLSNYQTQTSAEAGIYSISDGNIHYLVYTDGKSDIAAEWAIQISGVENVGDITEAVLESA